MVGGLKIKKRGITPLSAYGHDIQTISDLDITIKIDAPDINDFESFGNGEIRDLKGSIRGMNITVPSWKIWKHRVKLIFKEILFLEEQSECEKLYA